MRKYELTYLISDKVQESDLNKVTGKVSGYITELGGKSEKEEIWGRRKLVYPIKKQEFATYVTHYFNLSGDKIKEFERELRLTDGVLRQLLFVKDFGSKEITLTQDEIAVTEDVTEVIGGEKSFEAVEGETEESKDLMAVRESSSAEATEDKQTEEQKNEEIEKQEEEEIKTENISPEGDSLSQDSESVEKTAEPEAEELKEEKKEEKESKPKTKKVKKEEKDDDEAERLSKLNEELDDILKDEL